MRRTKGSMSRVVNAPGETKMNIKREIAALREMTTDQPRARYAEVFG